MKKILFTCIVILFLISALKAENAEEFFKKNCFSCHTIGGGKLTGPDLKNVHLRKDEAWLLKFIQTPEVILRSGDPYAAKILKEARGVRMTRVAGTTPSVVKGLLKFIKAESLKEKSKFAKSPLKERPITPEDVIFGRQLFLGDISLKNNGPSCINCHSIGDEGLFGGGTLGLDLTPVFGKLGGKKALMAWLSNPASETMTPLYKDHPIDEVEIIPLVGFLKSKFEKKTAKKEVHDFNILIIGFIGLIFLLIIFDLLWGKRIRSVRRTLVEGEQK